MTEEQKNWVDNASYRDLLAKWRFAPSGDPMFQGDVGAYYAKVMAQQRAELPDGAHVAASKSIGWGD